MARRQDNFFFIKIKWHKIKQWIYLHCFVNKFFRKFKVILMQSTRLLPYLAHCKEGKIQILYEESIKQKKVCVFPYYNPYQLLEKNTLTYLQQINKAGYAIIFVATSPVQSIEALKNHCSIILLRENMCNDFGSYKLGLEYLTKKIQLDSIEHLLLANSSVICKENALAEILFWCEKEKKQFTGYTQNRAISPHLQSYFLHFKQDAINTCIAFFEHFKLIKLNSKKIVRIYTIIRGEISLSTSLLNNFEMSSYIKAQDFPTSSLNFYYANKPALIKKNIINPGAADTEGSILLDLHLELDGSQYQFHEFCTWDQSNVYQLVFNHYQQDSFKNENLNINTEDRRWGIKKLSAGHRLTDSLKATQMLLNYAAQMQNDAWLGISEGSAAFFQQVKKDLVQSSADFAVFIFNKGLKEHSDLQYFLEQIDEKQVAFIGRKRGWIRYFSFLNEIKKDENISEEEKRLDAQYQKHHTLLDFFIKREIKVRYYW